MRGTGLNLRRLRYECLRREKRSTNEDGQAATVSRRQVLSMAGAAVVGTSPVLKTLEATSSRPFTFTYNSSRIVFWLHGRERWSIDARSFGGSPRLTVSEREDSIHIELRGACYPGTQLPADFVCTLRPSLSGWRMALRLPWGGFHATTGFEDWLLGKEPASSRVNVAPMYVQLGMTSSLAIQGRGTATIGPDWVIRVSGERIAAIRGIGGSVESGDTVISLLRAGAPSILSRPAGRRTTVELRRGTEEWDLGIDTTGKQAGTWKLEATGSAFDVIVIETSETRRGIVRRALLAGSAAQSPGMHFRLHAGQNGRAAPLLALRNPLYAISFGGRTDDAVLLANLEESSRIHLHGADFVLANHQDTPTFEMHRRGGAVQHLRITPRVDGLLAPLAGAVVAAGGAHSGVGLKLTAGRVRHRGEDHVFHVNLDEAHQHARAAAVPIDFVAVLRPRDLLAFQFNFVNFSLDTSATPGRLVPMDSGKEGYLVASFMAPSQALQTTSASQPQHIAEEAFDDGGSGFTGRPVKALAASTTHLAFRIPRGKSIPYTLEALLDWNQYLPSMAPNAVPPGSTPARTQDYSPSRRPQLTETAIEAPFRLLVSPPARLDPAQDATVFRIPGWGHRSVPVEIGGVTELWHTRLYARRSDGSSPDEPPESTLPARAIFSTDYPTSTNNPFLTSLAARDRAEIATLSADWTATRQDPDGTNGLPYNPIPFEVRRLALSALGASLDFLGDWSGVDVQHGYHDPVFLKQWIHRASFGRDTYVRTIGNGYLFPFGHRASYIKLTERKFTETSSGKIAYLHQRNFIVVSQPIKTYTVDDYPVNWDAGLDGRTMPFKTVRIVTEITPDLAPPPSDHVDLPSEANRGVGIAWWASTGSPGSFQHVPFEVVATDAAGQDAEFTIPMIFVNDVVSFDGSSTVPQNATDMKDVQKAYVDAAALSNRRRNLQGQHVAMADPRDHTNPDPNAPDPSVEASTIVFTVNVPDKDSGGNTIVLPQNQPRFYPAVESIMANVPALKTLIGQAAPVSLVYSTAYQSSGFDPQKNPGQVFAYLTAPGTTTVKPFPLTFGNSGGSPKTPGVLTPNLSVGGLSASHGPVGGGTSADIEIFAGGTFDPKKYFGALSGAKILGSINLVDILPVPSSGANATVSPATSPSDLSAVPKMITQTLPDRIRTSMTWETTNIVPSGIFKPDSGAALHMTVISDTPLSQGGSPAAPSFSIVGMLSNFRLDFSVLEIPFESVTFTVTDGQKIGVSPKLSPVVFNSPLDFVQAMEAALSSVLHADVSIDIDPTQVTAGFSVGVPAIAAGAFSISNINLGTRINIPFTGDPVRFRFNLSDQDNPFLLTVYGVAGGGSVAIEVGADGVERMDVSLDFGGNFELNLGVASGGVHLLGGIAMHWESNDEKLTAFINCGGEVDCLGIASVSTQFYIDLQYDPGTKVLAGDAKLVLEVKVAFFSKSVEVSVHKELQQLSKAAALTDRRIVAANSSGPKISKLISRSQWQTYCGAFV